MAHLLLLAPCAPTGLFYLSCFGLCCLKTSGVAEQVVRLVQDISGLEDSDGVCWRCDRGGRGGSEIVRDQSLLLMDRLTDEVRQEPQ